MTKHNKKFMIALCGLIATFVVTLLSAVILFLTPTLSVKAELYGTWDSSKTTYTTGADDFTIDDYGYITGLTAESRQGLINEITKNSGVKFKFAIPAEVNGITVIGFNTSSGSMFTYSGDNRILNHVYELTLPDTFETFGSYINSDNNHSAVSRYHLSGSRITEVTLPASVKDINYAFYGCSSLKQVYYAPNPKFTTMHSTFYGCTSLDTFCPNTNSGKEEGGVRVPEGVTAMSSTFYDCYNTAFKTVELPESLTYLGSYTFYECSNLSSIDIPPSVTEIGSFCFATSSSYTSRSNDIQYIDLPANLEVLGNACFDYASSLKEITIPAKVKSIGSDTFEQATSLQAVYWAKDSQIESIGQSAFYISNSTLRTIRYEDAYYDEKGVEDYPSVDMPDNLKSIDGNSSYVYAAFYYNNTYIRSYSNSIYYVNDIDYSGGSEKYQYWAFYSDSNSNTSCNVRSDTVGLASYLFYNWKYIETLYLPTTVKYIGNYIIYNNNNFRNLYIGDYDVTDPDIVENSESELVSIGNNAFYSTDICRTGADTPNPLYLPNTVRSIGSSAFYGCKYIKSVYLHEGLTSLNTQTFYNCTRLESVSFPSTLAEVPTYFLSGCTALTSVEFRSVDGKTALKRIGDYAFRSTALTELILPDGLESIGDEVFDIPTLESVNIPDSVTELGSMLFGQSYDWALAKGLCESNGKLIHIGKNFLYPVNNVREIYEEDWHVEGIEDGYVMSQPFFYVNEGDGISTVCEYVELPNWLTKLVSEEFYYAASVKHIVLPSSLETIESDAIEYSYGIESITFADIESSNLRYIDSYFIDQAPLLTSFTFPDSIEFIGYNAFYDCSSLKAIYLPNKTEVVYDEDFADNCRSDTLKIIAPNKEIYEDFLEKIKNNPNLLGGDNLNTNNKLPTSIITYQIPVNYHGFQSDDVNGGDFTEYRLWNHKFNVTRDEDGGWSEKADGGIAFTPQEGYEKSFYYTDAACSEPFDDVGVLDSKLVGSSAAKQIDIYARFYAKPEFTAPEGLIYGDEFDLGTSAAAPARNYNAEQTNIVFEYVSPIGTDEETFTYNMQSGEGKLPKKAGHYKMSAQLVDQATYGTWNDEGAVEFDIEPREITLSGELRDEENDAEYQYTGEVQVYEFDGAGVDGATRVEVEGILEEDQSISASHVPEGVRLKFRATTATANQGIYYSTISTGNYKLTVEPLVGDSFITTTDEDGLPTYNYKIDASKIDLQLTIGKKLLKVTTTSSDKTVRISQEYDPNSLLKKDYKITAKDNPDGLKIDGLLDDGTAVTITAILDSPDAGYYTNARLTTPGLPAHAKSLSFIVQVTGDSDVVENYQTNAIEQDFTLIFEITPKKVIYEINYNNLTYTYNGANQKGNVGVTIYNAVADSSGYTKGLECTTIMVRKQFAVDEKWDYQLLVNGDGDTPFQNAGTYQMSIGFQPNSNSREGVDVYNYEAVGVSAEGYTKEVIMHKKVVTPSWSDSELVYTGTAQAPTVTLSGVLEGEESDVTPHFADPANIVANAYGTLDEYGNARPFVAGNKHTAVLTLTGDKAENYCFEGRDEPTSYDVTYYIRQAELGATWTATDKSVSAETVDTFTYSASSGISRTALGERNVKFKNTTANSAEYVYNGWNVADAYSKYNSILTAVLTGKPASGAAADFILTFSTDAGDTTTQNAGVVYIVKVKLTAENGNYYIADGNDFTVTIIKREVTVNIENASGLYGTKQGVADEALNATNPADGLKSGVMLKHAKGENWNYGAGSAQFVPYTYYEVGGSHTDTTHEYFLALYLHSPNTASDWQNTDWSSIPFQSAGDTVIVGKFGWNMLTDDGLIDGFNNEARDIRDNYIVTFTGENLNVDDQGNGGGKFTINKVDLSEAETVITLNVGDDGLTYTGSALTPEYTVEVTMEVDGETITFTATYTAEYANNIEAYTDSSFTAANAPALTLTGTDNFEGEAVLNFIIKKAQSTVDVNEMTDEFTYTGKPIELSGAVANGVHSDTYDDVRYYFVEGEDLGGEVGDGIVDANTYTVRVVFEGNDNYLGSESTLTVVVRPYTLTKENINVNPIADLVYINAEQTPTPTVTLKDAEMRGVAFTLGTGYEFIYANNTNAGDGTLEDPAKSPTATIRGMGNFTGEIILYFTIKPADISDAEITIEGADDGFAYTGVAHTPNVTFKLSVTSGGQSYSFTQETVEYEISYSNNVNAYTDSKFEAENAPTITLTGKNNYTGTAVAHFVIAKAQVTVTGVYSHVYDGKNTVTAANLAENLASLAWAGVNGETPDDLKVTSLSFEFISGTEPDVRAVPYSVTASEITIECTIDYSGNNNYGSANVLIDLNITPVDVSADGSVTVSGTYTYTGFDITAEEGDISISGITPAPTAADYSVSYANNVNAYTDNTFVADNAPTITLTFFGNYSGTLTAHFVIARRSIAPIGDATEQDMGNWTVHIPDGGYVYTGSALEPTVSVTFKDGGLNFTNEQINYSTSFENTTNAYTDSTYSAEKAPTIIVTGTGNFEGTVTFKFTIAKATLAFAGTIGKIYNANDTITGEIDEHCSITSPTVSDLSLSASYTVKLSSANAGTYTGNYTSGGLNITLTAFNVTGTGVENFETSPAKVDITNLTAVIQKAKLKGTGSLSASRAYDGTTTYEITITEKTASSFEEFNVEGYPAGGTSFTIKYTLTARYDELETANVGTYTGKIGTDSGSGSWLSILRGSIEEEVGLDNYEIDIEGDVEFTLEITPVEVSYELGDGNDNFVYLLGAEDRTSNISVNINGTALSLGRRLSASSADAWDYDIVLSKTILSEMPEATYVSVPFTDAGTYYVYVIFNPNTDTTGSPNYVFADTQTADKAPTVVMARAELEVVLTSDTSGYIYDSQDWAARIPFAPRAAGNNVEHAENIPVLSIGYTVTYKKDGAASDTITDAGNYTLILTLTDTNFKITGVLENEKALPSSAVGADGLSGEATLTVGKRTVNITGWQFAGEESVYAAGDAISVPYDGKVKKLQPVFENLDNVVHTGFLSSAHSDGFISGLKYYLGSDSNYFTEFRGGTAAGTVEPMSKNVYRVYADSAYMSDILKNYNVTADRRFTVSEGSLAISGSLDLNAFEEFAKDLVYGYKDNSAIDLRTLTLTITKGANLAEKYAGLEIAGWDSFTGDSVTLTFNLQGANAVKHTTQEQREGYTLTVTATIKNADGASDYATGAYAVSALYAEATVLPYDVTAAELSWEYIPTNIDDTTFAATWLPLDDSATFTFTGVDQSANVRLKWTNALNGVTYYFSIDSTFSYLMMSFSGSGGESTFFNADTYTVTAYSNPDEEGVGAISNYSFKNVAGQMTKELTIQKLQIDIKDVEWLTQNNRHLTDHKNAAYTGFPISLYATNYNDGHQTSIVSVEYSGDDLQIDPKEDGDYTRIATLTFSGLWAGNCTFICSEYAEGNTTAHGTIVVINDDGATAVLTKYWNIVRINNSLKNQNFINGGNTTWVYGEKILYETPIANLDGAPALTFSLTVVSGGENVLVAGKLNVLAEDGTDNLINYINSAMPVGSYRLIIHFAEFNDDNGEHTAYDDTISITVTYAEIDFVNANSFNGKSFLDHTYTGGLHYWDETLSPEINLAEVTENVDSRVTANHWVATNEYAIYFKTSPIASERYKATLSADGTEVVSVAAGAPSSIIPVNVRDSNGGIYTIYYEVAAANHGNVSGSFTVKVNPRPVKVTLSAEEGDVKCTNSDGATVLGYVYGDEDIDGKITIIAEAFSAEGLRGLVEGDNLVFRYGFYSSDKTQIGLNAAIYTSAEKIRAVNMPVNAGNYLLKIVLASGDSLNVIGSNANYVLDYDDEELWISTIVGRKAIDINPADSETVYNGVAQYYVLTEPAASIVDTADYNAELGKTDAGEYTVTLHIDDNHMWTDGKYADITVNFVISPAEITISSKAAPENWYYNREAYSATLLFEEYFQRSSDTFGMLPEHIYQITVKGTKHGGEELLDADDYTVIITLTDGNFKFADGTNSISFKDYVTVHAAQINVTLGDSEEHRYTHSEYPVPYTITANAENGFNSDVRPVLPFEEEYTVSVSGKTHGGASLLNADEYTISFVIDGDYAHNFEVVETVDNGFKIIPARISVLADEEFVYDGTDQKAKITVISLDSEDDTFGSEILDFTLDGEVVEEFKNAGVYTITIDASHLSNFESLSDFTVEMHKRSVTLEIVEGQSFVYGSAAAIPAPVLRLSDSTLGEGDTLDMLYTVGVYTDFAHTTALAPDDAVGSAYIIYAEEKDEADNYRVFIIGNALPAVTETFGMAYFAITPADIGYETVNDGNRAGVSEVELAPYGNTTAYTITYSFTANGEPFTLGSQGTGFTTSSVSRIPEITVLDDNLEIHVLIEAENHTAVEFTLKFSDAGKDGVTGITVAIAIGEVERVYDGNLVSVEELLALADVTDFTVNGVTHPLSELGRYLELSIKGMGEIAHRGEYEVIATVNSALVTADLTKLDKNACLIITTAPNTLGEFTGGGWNEGGTVNLPTAPEAKYGNVIVKYYYDAECKHEMNIDWADVTAGTYYAKAFVNSNSYGDWDAIESEPYAIVVGGFFEGAELGAPITLLAVQLVVLVAAAVLVIKKKKN